MSKFKRVKHPLAANFVYEKPNRVWYVSYNPGPILRSSEETALVIKTPIDGLNTDTPVTFLILDGDYRKEYEQCNTLLECLKVFCSHPDEVSGWSACDNSQVMSAMRDSEHLKALIQEDLKNDGSERYTKSISKN